MSGEKIYSFIMSLTINVDRFTRLNQSLSGKFLPAELAGLSEYLAGEGGEINYSMKGTLTVDHSGSQQRRVKCIIWGWFLLIDPVTLAVVRHTLDIDSSLVLVEDESGLPPLEMESENEDYVVCGANMDVAERVEEEVLLSLPAQTVSYKAMIEIGLDRLGTGTNIAPENATKLNAPVTSGEKQSPFAKLAKWQKK